MIIKWRNLHLTYLIIYFRLLMDYKIYVIKDLISEVTISNKSQFINFHVSFKNGIH